MSLPVTEIHSWQELIAVEAKLSCESQEWVFRGQASASLPLTSTLERACDDFGVDPKLIVKIEDALLQDFKRSCHVYAPLNVPRDKDDILSWFALMRHYGAPCRFLDFTFSLFVACYFAAAAEKADPTIWAVNKSWLTRSLESLFDRAPDGRRLRESWYSRTDHSAFRSLFIDGYPKVNLIAPLNPFQMNDRLLAQQGLFLCATDTETPFEATLIALPDAGLNVQKIHIKTPRARREILNRLHRTGVNGAVLFPGLQGFAESLRPKILTYLWLQDLRGRGGRLGPATIGV